MLKKCFNWLKQKALLALFALWALLALPPIATLLESRMWTHMLVQISLLVVIGFRIGKHLHHARHLHKSKPSLNKLLKWRLPLLVLAISTMMLWMIPRLLDLAVESMLVEAIKMLSLPMLAGFPLYFAWVGFGPVVRGILHLEALATLLRLGWLYLASPTRLCVQYDLDDQVRLGQTLLFLGLVYGIYLLKQALITPHFAGNEQTNSRQIKYSESQYWGI